MAAARRSTLIRYLIPLCLRLCTSARSVYHPSWALVSPAHGCTQEFCLASSIYPRSIRVIEPSPAHRAGWARPTHRLDGSLDPTAWLRRVMVLDAVSMTPIGKCQGIQASGNGPCYFPWTQATLEHHMPLTWIAAAWSASCVFPGRSTRAGDPGPVSIRPWASLRALGLPQPGWVVRLCAGLAISRSISDASSPQTMGFCPSFSGFQCS